MKGAAAMSVEMCEVTEISSADGTAASAIQRAASRQVGAGSSEASVTGASAGRGDVQHQPAAPCDQRDQHDEQHGPAARLLAERAQRLQHEGI